MLSLSVILFSLLIGFHGVDSTPLTVVYDGTPPWVLKQQLQSRSKYAAGDVFPFVRSLDAAGDDGTLNTDELQEAKDPYRLLHVCALRVLQSHQWGLIQSEYGKHASQAPKTAEWGFTDEVNVEMLEELTPSRAVQWLAAACLAGFAPSCEELGTLWLFVSPEVLQLPTLETIVGAAAEAPAETICSALADASDAFQAAGGHWPNDGNFLCTGESPDLSSIPEPWGWFPVAPLSSVGDAARLIGYSARDAHSPSAAFLLVLMHFARFRVAIFPSDEAAAAVAKALAQQFHHLPARLLLGHRALTAFAFRSLQQPHGAMEGIASRHSWLDVTMATEQDLSKGEKPLSLYPSAVDAMETANAEASRVALNPVEEQLLMEGLTRGMPETACWSAQMHYQMVADAAMVDLPLGMEREVGPLLRSHWMDTNSQLSFHEQQEDLEYIIQNADNDPYAAHDLAALHMRGDAAAGVRQDAAEAARLFERAAQEGVPEANLQLGTLFLTGLGVDRNTTKAKEHFKVAADAGHPSAHVGLSNIYLYDEAEYNATAAIYHLELAAEGDVPEAHANLGYLYLEGNTVAMNPEKALFHLNKAIEAGLGHARYCKSFILLNGLLGERKCFEGVTLLREVAEKAMLLEDLPISEGFAASVLLEASEMFGSSEAPIALRHYATLAALGMKDAQTNAAFLIHRMPKESLHDFLGPWQSLKGPWGLGEAVDTPAYRSPSGPFTRETSATLNDFFAFATAKFVKKPAGTTASAERRSEAVEGDEPQGSAPWWQSQGLTHSVIEKHFLLQASIQHEPEALFQLYECYRDAWPTACKENNTVALAFLQRAAAANHSEAVFYLAYHFSEGLRATSGDPSSPYLLQPNVTEAWQLLLRLSDLNDAGSWPAYLLQGKILGTWMWQQFMYTIGVGPQPPGSLSWKAFVSLLTPSQSQTIALESVQLGPLQIDEAGVIAIEASAWALIMTAMAGVVLIVLLCFVR